MNLILDDNNHPIDPIPLFVEIFMGKHKGIIGYTFDAFFPIVVFDDINQTELIMPTPSGVRFITQEEYEQKVKEIMRDG